MVSTKTINLHFSLIFRPFITPILFSLSCVHKFFLILSSFFLVSICKLSHCLCFFSCFSFSLSVSISLSVYLSFCLYLSLLSLASCSFSLSLSLNISSKATKTSKLESNYSRCPFCQLRNI